jgi:hypothetical protein
VGLEAPLILIELRARHAALLAGSRHITQRLGWLQHAQALFGDLDLWR